MSRKCDKFESDDFRNEMKNEFELICKALNESKMLWLVLLLMDYSLPQVYGRTGSTVGVEGSILQDRLDISLMYSHRYLFMSLTAPITLHCNAMSTCFRLSFSRHELLEGRNVSLIFVSSQKSL